MFIDARFALLFALVHPMLLASCGECARSSSLDGYCRGDSLMTCDDGSHRHGYGGGSLKAEHTRCGGL